MSNPCRPSKATRLSRRPALRENDQDRAPSSESSLARGLRRPSFDTRVLNERRGDDLRVSRVGTDPETSDVMFAKCRFIAHFQFAHWGLSPNAVDERAHFREERQMRVDERPHRNPIWQHDRRRNLAGATESHAHWIRRKELKPRKPYLRSIHNCTINCHSRPHPPYGD